MFVYVMENLVALQVLRVEVQRSSWISRADSFCTVLYMRAVGIGLYIPGGLATLAWTRDLLPRCLCDDSLCRRTVQLFAVPSPVRGCLLEDGVPDSTCIFQLWTNQAFLSNLLNWASELLQLHRFLHIIPRVRFTLIFTLLTWLVQDKSSDMVTPRYG